LHIADAEVNRLASTLAKLERTTKTEAVWRALRQTLADRRREVKRKGFREFGEGLVAAGREQGIAPVTKEEMDTLWGMDVVDQCMFQHPRS
jgi:hypothetical protein